MGDRICLIAPSPAFGGSNSVRTEASAHHGKGLVRTQTS